MYLGIRSDNSVSECFTYLGKFEGSWNSSIASGTDLYSKEIVIPEDGIIIMSGTTTWSGPYGTIKILYDRQAFPTYTNGYMTTARDYNSDNSRHGFGFAKFEAEKGKSITCVARPGYEGVGNDYFTYSGNIAIDVYLLKKQ